MKRKDLRRLSSEGLARRFTELGDGLDQDEYKTRLNHELDIIEGMGFPAIFSSFRTLLIGRRVERYEWVRAGERSGEFGGVESADYRS